MLGLLAKRPLKKLLLWQRELRPERKTLSKASVAHVLKQDSGWGFRSLDTGYDACS
jgi:hypothetical protein